MSEFSMAPDNKVSAIVLKSIIWIVKIILYGLLEGSSKNVEFLTDTNTEEFLLIST